MLKDEKERKLLSEKDSDGRTALHLATICPCGGDRVSTQVRKPSKSGTRREEHPSTVLLFVARHQLFRWCAGRGGPWRSSTPEAALAALPWTCGTPPSTGHLQRSAPSSVLISRATSKMTENVSQEGIAYFSICLFVRIFFYSGHFYTVEEDPQQDRGGDAREARARGEG